jgi:hypothetical protein
MIKARDPLCYLVFYHKNQKIIQGQAMAKITTFAQIIKLIPRSTFESAVIKYNGDKGVRTLDCWTWFGALMFSQLSGHDSIRALEKVFSIGNQDVNKLGFNSIHRSTLSDANLKRPVAILEEVYKFCLELAKKNTKTRKLDLDFPVYLLDSTFIELCLSLCPWAYYRRSDKKTGNVKYAGIKIHTAIDLAGHIPEFLVIQEGTEAQNGDLKIARECLKFPPKSLVVFDRGYWSLNYFNELNKNQVSFVTRIRNKKIKYRVAKSSQVNRTLGLKCDQHIYFNSEHTKGKYQGKLRKISYKDPSTQKLFVFITNRFDLPAEKICALYKARWQVELFFRLIKQNFKVKKFLGLNKNAVLAQLYAALISYVLLSYLKSTSRSSISMPDLMAVVGTFLLIKLSLIDVLTDHPKTTRHPVHDVLQLSFFSTA